MDAKAVYRKESNGSYTLLGYLIHSKDDVGEKSEDVEYGTVTVE